MKVVLTETAIGDLVGIGEFIRQDNPARAEIFVAGLEQRCRTLGAMPRAYPWLPGERRAGSAAARMAAT